MFGKFFNQLDAGTQFNPTETNKERKKKDINAKMIEITHTPSGIKKITFCRTANSPDQDKNHSFQNSLSINQSIKSFQNIPEEATKPSIFQDNSNHKQYNEKKNCFQIFNARKSLQVIPQKKDNFKSDLSSPKGLQSSISTFSFSNTPISSNMHCKGFENVGDLQASKKTVTLNQDVTQEVKEKEIVNKNSNDSVPINNSILKKNNLLPGNNSSFSSEINSHNNRSSLNNSTFSERCSRNNKLSIFSQQSNLSQKTLFSLSPSKTSFNLKLSEINFKPNTEASENLTEDEIQEINNNFLQMSKYNNFQKCIEHLEKYINCLNLNQVDEKGWASLHYAVWNTNIKFISLLLTYGADPNARTLEGETPLMMSAKLASEQMCVYLLNGGADWQIIDIKGNTALNYAIMTGSLPCVRLLSQHLSKEHFLRKNKDQQNLIEVCKDERIKSFLEGVKAKISASGSYHSDGPPSNSSTIFNSSNLLKSLGKINIDSSGSIDTPNTLSLEVINLKVGPQDFIAYKKLGSGNLGDVYLVQKKDTNKLYAMKITEKSKIISCNLLNYAITEKNVLTFSQNPFIIKLVYAFQTESKLFLVMNYCSNGNLAEHLQVEKRFSEDKAKFFISALILALEDLHKRDIIFRDLKPESILIDEEGFPMLTDFGLSKEGVLDSIYGAKSFCGSLAYLAPEMLKKIGHGKAVDWYLLGVLFYELLVGFPPYFAQDKDVFIQNILTAPLKVPSWLSANAKSLLVNLLQRNPSKRLGSGGKDAQELKDHEFFKEIEWDQLYQRYFQQENFLLKLVNIFAVA